MYLTDVRMLKERKKEKKMTKFVSMYKILFKHDLHYGGHGPWKKTNLVSSATEENE